MLGLVSKLLSGTDTPSKSSQDKATDSKEEKEHKKVSSRTVRMTHLLTFKYRTIFQISTYSFLQKGSTDEAPEGEKEDVQSESKDGGTKDPKPVTDQTEEAATPGKADDGQKDEKETDDGSKTDDDEKDDADADDEDEGDAANSKST